MRVRRFIHEFKQLGQLKIDRAHHWTGKGAERRLDGSALLVKEMPMLFLRFRPSMWADTRTYES